MSRRSTHEIPASRKRKGQVSSQSPQQESETEEASPVFKFDRTRFLTKSKQQRYIDIEGRRILEERRVELNSGDWDEFTDEIIRRKWDKIASPESKYNEELVKEFYANAYQMQPHEDIRKSWVRRTQIPYDREAINEFLGGHLPSREDDLTRLKKAMALSPSRLTSVLCLPGRSYGVGRTGKPLNFLRKDLKTIVRIWQNFLFCNVMPLTHISDLNIPRAEIICCILQRKTIDIARIISDEIHSCALSTPAPTGISKPLAFPGLITGLIKAGKVQVPSHPSRPLRLPINLSYIRTHCINLEEGVEGPQPQRQTHQQQHPMQNYAELSSAIHHLGRMQISNHLAMQSLNQSLYQQHQQQYYGAPSFPWPAPDTFDAFIQWPGDGPFSSQGGQVPATQAEQGADEEEGEDDEETLDEEDED